MKTRLIAITATLALCAGATAAFAGIGEELSLAQTHALLAYRTGGRGERGITQGRMYVQHVINCLVGPGGQGYDLTAPDLGPGRANSAATAPTGMDPCAADKSNKGALNDATSAAQKQKVQAALALAKAALAITDNEKLTDAATALADAVGEAKE
jgi:hypothetical protein